MVELVIDIKCMFGRMLNMRKLVSVQKIAEIKSIPNADAIEAVRINGWWVVSKKNEFKMNDLCVYFEIDSFLPVHPEFEFLRKSCYRNTTNIGEGFRLKTIKLKKQISQGLVLPITLFEAFGHNSNNFDIGDDCTDVFGVQKWEPPVSTQLAGDAKGNFPNFIKKTDQERVQNIYDDLKAHYENDVFEATLKLDGTSMTVYYNDGEFGVCSRNIDLKETDGNTYWKVARKLNLESLLRSYGKNIAIQGELMGPGIQGNREKLADYKFFVFDVWDIDEQKYVSFDERDYIVSSFVLDRVPILGDAVIFSFSLDEILEKSKIKSLTHPIAEGIVYRCLADPSVSFKAINQEFLLKEE